jgi:hypothetical protein
MYALTQLYSRIRKYADMLLCIYAAIFESMQICNYADMLMRTCSFIHLDEYTNTHICIYTNTLLCVDTQTPQYTDTPVHDSHTRAHTHSSIHTRIRVHSYADIHMRARTHASEYTPSGATQTAPHGDVSPGANTRPYGARMRPHVRRCVPMCTLVTAHAVMPAHPRVLPGTHMRHAPLVGCKHPGALEHGHTRPHPHQAEAHARTHARTHIMRARRAMRTARTRPSRSNSCSRQALMGRRAVGT